MTSNSADYSNCIHELIWFCGFRMHISLIAITLVQFGFSSSYSHAYWCAKLIFLYASAMHFAVFFTIHSKCWDPRSLISVLCPCMLLTISLASINKIISFDNVSSISFAWICTLPGLQAREGDLVHLNYGPGLFGFAWCFYMETREWRKAPRVSVDSRGRGFIN